MRYLVALVCLPVLSFLSCKKDPKPTPSVQKQINSFVFRSTDNAGVITTDVSGVIRNDSILLGVPNGTSLSNLRPFIQYAGASLSPASGAAQNFSTSQRYTVTAEDGSTRTYTVVVKQLSNSKSILSFAFRAADNAGVISTDVSGIISNDTIRVLCNANPQNLVPFITYNGVSIFPGSATAQNFSTPVSYTVTAEDGSTKNYVVIVQANLTVFAGNGAGYIYALDAATGQLKWRYLTGGAVKSTPTIANGIVFAGSDDKYLYALDATTGGLIWRALLLEAVQCSPVVANGTVYASVASVTSYLNPSLYAFDATNGAQKFAKGFPGLLGTNATVWNGRLYTGDIAYGMNCFDAANGNLLWSYNAGITRSNPAIINGKIYFGSEFNTLVCIDALTGVQQWRSFAGYGNTNPSVSNQTVFANHEDTLYAADALTGNRKWFIKVSGSNFIDALATNDVVYAAHGNGRLYAMNASNGTQLWNYIVNPFLNAGAIYPTAANGIVYANSSSGNIYAIDAATGNLRWSYQTGAAVTTGVCVTDYLQQSFHPAISGEQQ